MAGIFVGNTDNDWFDFLSTLHEVDEVNFWKPSSQNFKALKEGERFAFRLKAPRNSIGGFGTFVKSSALPIQVAWEMFGVKNGVPTLDALVSAIAKLRPGEHITPSSFILCRVLVEPVFLPPSAWFDVPASWAKNIVGGKLFSTNADDGAMLLRQLEGIAPSHEQKLGFGENTQSKYGAPVFVTPRLGQGAFRVTVTEMYRRECALTGGRVLPALDAAHIRPYAEGGTHTKSNGILLRKDIHSVFDAGYATIDKDYHFVVSDKVREVFNNGNEYRRLHGVKLRVPKALSEQPDVRMLQWHNENRFLG